MKEIKIFTGIKIIWLQKDINKWIERERPDIIRTNTNTIYVPHEGILTTITILYNKTKP